MSLPQLRCVCASARHGSFTAAAEALGVSQPAVAEHVRRLEQALGTDLFTRLGRGVRPTTAGAAVAEHAERSLRALDEATGTVEDLGALRTGTVTLGFFGHPGAYHLERFTSSFLREHPGIRLRIVGRNSSITAQRVRDGELEAAVVVLPIDDAGLDVRPLARGEVRYASADPTRTRAPVTIEQVAAAPLVFYDAESGNDDPIRRQLAERAQAQGLRLVPRVEVEFMDVALRIVAGGIGDTYVPLAHLLTPGAPRGLRSAPIDPPIHDTFAFVTRSGSRLSPAMQALAEAFGRHLDEVTARLDRM